MNADFIEFTNWFAGQELGQLEDVREFIAMHAWDNAAESGDMLKVACATVMSYLDDVDMANEVFNAYR